MFYLLLVIRDGLAASYLLPITDKKEAGEAGEAGEKNFLLSKSSSPPLCLFPIPNAQCPIQKLSI
ncbi:MAG: hypothetical protein V7K32_10725 [Nostoc sp.]|uniref:hypothetical protein n=1 Tax=Nostoc sp. TaxID=1180 RepID=UPI002FF63751